MTPAAKATINRHDLRAHVEAVIARRNLAAAISGQDRTAAQDRRESEVRDG